MLVRFSIELAIPSTITIDQSRSLATGSRHPTLKGSRVFFSLQVGEESNTAHDTCKGDGNGREGGLALTIALVLILVVADGLAGLGDDVGQLARVAGNGGGGLGVLRVGGGGGDVAQGGEDVARDAGEGGLDVGPGTARVGDDVLDLGLDVPDLGAEVANVAADAIDEGLDVVEDVLGLRLGLGGLS